MKAEINGADLTITASEAEDIVNIERWKDAMNNGSGTLFIKTPFAYRVERVDGLTEVARDNEGLSEG